MEEDPLFEEEAEPPGRSTGSQTLKISGSGFLPPPRNQSSPPVFLMKTNGQSVTCKENPRSPDFRKRFFPATSYQAWHDWHWQLKNRITDADRLSEILRLSSMERLAVERGRAMPLAITPYYASLLHADDASHPLRRTVIPSLEESAFGNGEQGDPLEEERDSPVPGIVHRYPDRVLFLVTDYCSTYCRYCTRSRLVGGSNHPRCDERSWEKGIAYITGNPGIRDVLLSGGDPLTLSDERLEWLLARLKMIPHVEMVRIGTKVPVVMPQRITPALVRVLKRYHPLWMSLHVTHPEELTPEMYQACKRLADAGIPLGSQTVLLAGINDNVETMTRLVRGLLQFRVKPYYLYQCDPIPGSYHFRTPISKGLEIIQGLRGHTTGYAVPSYVIDAPGGGGKIPLLPEYLVGKEGNELILRNYAGGLYRYPDCIPTHEIFH